jgi:prepilin-type N-terminal cleavage/methylation domain-containing protein
MKKFTKTSLRGFTLIELLVVIAIIGLLSTAIMGPVQTGLKKGRDTRKISDITQIQGALLQYAGDNNGSYPIWLAYGSDPMYTAIGFAGSSLASSTATTYMKPDDKMIYGLSAARDRFMYTVYADAAGNIVSYHLGTALENQNASLQGDADCQASSSPAVAATAVGAYVTSVWGGITGATGCTSIIAGSYLNTNAWSAAGGEAGNNGHTSSGSVSKAEDFSGAGKKELAGDTCTSKLDTCIFDITPN